MLENSVERIASWIPKATHTLRIRNTFRSKDGCTNTPQCYIYTHIVSRVEYGSESGDTEHKLPS